MEMFRLPFHRVSTVVLVVMIYTRRNFRAPSHWYRKYEIYGVRNRIVIYRSANLDDCHRSSIYFYRCLAESRYTIGLVRFPGRGYAISDWLTSRRLPFGYTSVISYRGRRHILK